MTAAACGPPPFGIDAVDEWRALTDALAAEEAAGVRVACQDSPETWYASQPASPETTLAVRCCTDCPVRQPCADYALAAREPHGVWGGLTVKDRRELLDDQAAS